MTSLRQILTLSCLLVAIASGCGSTKHEAIPTTTSTTAQQSPTDAAVIQDYRAFWDDYLAVTNPMTPGNPRISAHATGQELTTLNGVVLGGHNAGTIFKGSFELHPTVATSTATTATVHDCYIDRTGAYSVSTGQRVDKDDETPANITVSMVLVNGVWKVSAIDNESTPCTP
jgi:hypothetical protein